MNVRSSLEYTTQRQEISKELVAGHNFAEGLPKKSEIKESSALKVKTTVRPKWTSPKNNEKSGHFYFYLGDLD